MRHNLVLKEEVLKNFQKRGILLENLHTDGMLMKLYTDMKEAFKDFGTLLGASAKLLLTDITHISSIVFGRPKSLKEYKEMRKRVKARKVQHWTQISASQKKLRAHFPEGEIMSLMYNPAGFMFSRAMEGDIFSIDAKGWFNEAGLTELPIVGPLFGGDVKSVVWNGISDIDPNGSPEEVHAQFQRILSIGTPQTDADRGLFNDINNVFMFAGKRHTGPVLKEGEEGETSGNVVISEKLKKVLTPIVKEMLEEWIDGTGIREQYIKDREEEFEPIISEAEQVINIHAEIMTTTDKDRFFDLMEELKKAGGDATQDMDVSQIKPGFEKLQEDFLSDETKKQEFKEKAIEKKLIDEKEEDEQKIEEKLLELFNETCLKEMKSKMLPNIKQGLEEYYAYIEELITDGCEEKDLELIGKTGPGKKFVKQVKDYKQRINNALSNF